MPKSQIALARRYLKEKYKPLKFQLLKLGIGNPIKKRRLKLSILIENLFNSTVAYGPFKGLKLSSDTWWGKADKASMFLGLYEREILDSLAKIPKQYKTFIDLGAADGYYGVGVLINNHFDRSYCFEISKSGQKAILKNAELNSVSNRIIIHGIAEKDFLKHIPVDQLSKSVLLVDIEGGEFDLFDYNLFEILKNSIIFIELHEWLVVEGDRKLEKLKRDADRHFNITEITTTNRDLSVFPELKNFSDTDRWMICSEGRKQLMTWWRLDPKSESIN